jgi:hypothetical protein
MLVLDIYICRRNLRWAVFYLGFRPGLGHGSAY